MKTKLVIKVLVTAALIITCFEIALHLKLFVLSRNIVTFKVASINLPAINNRELIKAVQNVTFFKVENKEASEKCQEGKEEDRVRVFRDILSDIPQGSLKSLNVSPEDIPNTVHYTWCGSKKFRFEDHLGFLSFVRILRPVKIVFHYNHLPSSSAYHEWFQELRQSLPQLVLRKTDKHLRCNTTDSLNFALEQIAASLGGGIYFGERAALTFIPTKWKNEDYLTYMVPGAVSGEQMIVYSKYGLVNKSVSFDMFKTNILIKTSSCVTVDQFNTDMKQYFTDRNSIVQQNTLSPCLALPGQIYPENIINISSPFAEISRKLFYGKSELMGAKQSQDPNDLIPAISHYISLAKDPNQPVEWTFSHYLSILSALYVGGFQRVYVHGDKVPVGKWWDRLHHENVTFVYIENIETVFQQKVKVLAHQSDILRSLILMKFGGVYQDRDVIWANPIHEDIRRYPTLMSYDWPDYGEWPRAINMGVLMSKAKSPFLSRFLDTFWLEKDYRWGYNGILMPYRTFEMNPETVLIYERLQIICFDDVCHPTWHSDYTSWKPKGTFSLDEPLAFHFTHPKPDPSLVSFETIRKGTNMAAKVAQRLLRSLEKCGKYHLLQ